MHIALEVKEYTGTAKRECRKEFYLFRKSQISQCNHGGTPVWNLKTVNVSGEFILALECAASKLGVRCLWVFT